MPTLAIRWHETVSHVVPQCPLAVVQVAVLVVCSHTWVSSRGAVAVALVGGWL